MKAKTKSINIILTMALMVSILFFSNKVEAASFSVSASNSTVTVGDTFTVTINGKGLTGRYTIAGNSNVSVSETSVWIENESKTVRCTTKAEGTATVTITPQTVADSTTGEDQSLSAKSVSVTVNAKETQKQNNENTESNEGNSENNSSSGSNGGSATGGNTTVSEPTFTDTNKTMYSTGNINLRASWSTSSSATSIEKGTELTVTGTSKEKVNGYVWYRVSYNGQTKYVASSLLTSTKPEEETKSDNANLKSLVVENFDIIPNFSSDVTEYTLDVTSEVNELTIKAEPEDSKATVTIKGEKELKEGENTVVISVNAEDGTTKLYEIKVTKKEETVFGLTSLKIKDANIEFKPDIYNYSINIQSDVDILEIQATASEEDATVEITGNEGLKEGENIITIMVSSKDGEKNATYQIKATKKEEKTSENVQSNFKIYIYAGIGIVALIALIIVIVYTVKHRNEDESEKNEGFPDELPEKDDNQEIDDTEKVKNVDLEEKKNNKEEREEIDRKNYFLDVQSEDDYEKTRKRRGKHF